MLMRGMHKVQSSVRGGGGAELVIRQKEAVLGVFFPTIGHLDLLQTAPSDSNSYFYVVEKSHS